MLGTKARVCTRAAGLSTSPPEPGLSSKSNNGNGFTASAVNWRGGSLGRANGLSYIMDRWPKHQFISIKTLKNYLIMVQTLFCPKRTARALVEYQGPKARAPARNACRRARPSSKVQSEVTVRFPYISPIPERLSSCACNYGVYNCTIILHTYKLIEY